MNTLPSRDEIYEIYKNTVSQNHELAWDHVIQEIKTSAGQGYNHCVIFREYTQYLTEEDIVKLREAGYKADFYRGYSKSSLQIFWDGEEYKNE